MGEEVIKSVESQVSAAVWVRNDIINDRGTYPSSNSKYEGSKFVWISGSFLIVEEVQSQFFPTS